MTISIAWVTPYGRRSDVSSFSKNILLELSESLEPVGGSVTIFVNENGPTYWTHLPIVRLSGTDQDREILSSFDFVFFNIGNNSGNHQYINWLAVSIPGIVIVHDMVMQHFVAEEVFERFHRKDFYARLVGEYYGETGLCTVGQSQICSDALRPIYAPWDTLHVTNMPLIEPFIECAAAVVVHSAYAEQFVAARYSGPILKLALPWDQKPCLSPQDLDAWRDATITRAVCQVVCFGYIGRAKCLDLVIAAFADSSLLRHSARLTIVGYPGDREYAEELKTMVHARGLGAVVEFEYSVSDERLLLLKQQADLFVNLRFPNTESASGSMVEQMNSGKPVLVYPSGCYAEIDDDAAVFVRREDGVRGIVNALKAIVSDPQGRIKIGDNGRAYARRIGRYEYVSSLLEFLREHADLLRSRKKLEVGQRNPAIRLSIEDELWLDRLVKTRRALAGLHRPVYELAVAPFQTWDRHTLTAFVTIGIFGQSAGSAFERECLALLSRNQRPDFYRIIGIARIFLLVCNGNETTAYTELLGSVTSSPMLCADVFVLLRSLGDAGFSRALYIGILGRWPNSDEVNLCVDGFSHRSVEVIIREFLTSAEFNRRNASQSAVARFLEWCDQEHFCAFDRPNLEYGLTMRFSTDFLESRGYLGSGWHQLEPGHVWSRSPISTLIFSVSDDIAVAELSLTITGRVTGTSQTGRRTLTAGCNGAAEIIMKIDDDEWFSFEVDLRRLSNGGDDFVVVLDIGPTINLAAEGIDHDTRALGFCLRSIRLHHKDIVEKPLAIGYLKVAA